MRSCPDLRTGPLGERLVDADRRGARPDARRRRRRPGRAPPARLMAEDPLPDPALVVLVGASGSGKSTWARQRYRSRRDRLVRRPARRGRQRPARPGRLGRRVRAARPDRRRPGAARADHRRRHARPGRRTTAGRGSTWPAAHGLPAVVGRVRHPGRRVPQPQRRARPAGAGAGAHRSSCAASGRAGRRSTTRAGTGSSWSSARTAPATPVVAEPAAASPERGTGLDVVLQVSRFPWGEDPAAWLQDVALAADEAGFAGIALMDHLIQIPQVGTAWEPIPEPWVTLGMLAGLDTRLRLGTLVTPVTFRPPGITAKTVATLDVISGGRAFCGVGAGWWEREHLGLRAAVPAGGRAARPARDRHRDDARAVGHRHQGRTTGSGSPCRRRRPTRGRSTTSR